MFSLSPFRLPELISTSLLFSHQCLWFFLHFFIRSYACVVIDWFAHLLKHNYTRHEILLFLNMVYIQCKANQVFKTILLLIGLAYLNNLFIELYRIVLSTITCTHTQHWHHIYIYIVTSSSKMWHSMLKKIEC